MLVEGGAIGLMRWSIGHWMLAWLVLPHKSAQAGASFS